MWGCENYEVRSTFFDFGAWIVVFWFWYLDLGICGSTPYKLD